MNEIMTKHINLLSPTVLYALKIKRNAIQLYRYQAWLKDAIENPR